MTMYRDCFAQRGLNLRIEILLDEKFDVISLRVFEYLLNGGEHGSRVRQNRQTCILRHNDSRVGDQQWRG